PVDANVSPVARRAVGADLLAGRATPDAASLISFVVRVASPAELPLAAHDLAALSSSMFGVDETPAGLRASKERLQGYAERVLEELPSTDEIDEMEDAFFRLARVVEQSTELRTV